MGTPWPSDVHAQETSEGVFTIAPDDDRVVPDKPVARIYVARVRVEGDVVRLVDEGSGTEYSRLVRAGFTELPLEERRRIGRELLHFAGVPTVYFAASSSEST